MPLLSSPERKAPSCAPPLPLRVEPLEDRLVLSWGATPPASFLPPAAFAVRLNAGRLVIAGTTPGVLDGAGATIPSAGPSEIVTLVNGGTATSGMIAKLRACESALAGGVDDVVIVDGRNGDALESAAWSESPAAATRLAPNEARYAETGRKRL